MRMTAPRGGAERGLALAAVLFVLVGIFFLTATLFFSTFLDLQAAANVSAGDDALYVAEAGIQHLWSILEPGGSFETELAWPNGEPPFGSPLGFPRPPRTYRVRVEALSGQKLRATSEGTSHRGTRRRVQAVFAREPSFRPPAALTFAEGSSVGNLAGALDASSDGAERDIPALGAESRALARALERARADIGRVAAVGPTGLPAALQRLRESAAVTIDNAREGGSFGTVDDPVVVRLVGNAALAGNTSIRGIVLADVPLRLSGRLDIDGLLIAPAGLEIGGELVVHGAAWVGGDVGSLPSGSVTVVYSSTSSDSGARAANGALPRRAILGAWREVW